MSSHIPAHQMGGTASIRRTLGHRGKKIPQRRQANVWEKLSLSHHLPTGQSFPTRQWGTVNTKAYLPGSFSRRSQTAAKDGTWATYFRLWRFFLPLFSDFFSLHLFCFFLASCSSVSGRAGGGSDLCCSKLSDYSHACWSLKAGGVGTHKKLKMILQVHSPW